jgi:hypothetical protein
LRLFENTFDRRAQGYSFSGFQQVYRLPSAWAADCRGITSHFMRPGFITNARTLCPPALFGMLSCHISSPTKINIVHYVY